MRTRPRGAARASIRGFVASRAGVAALEFALVVPMLIVLLCVGFELSRYVKAIRQITAASTTVAGLVAQNTSGSVNDTDLHFFQDAVMIAYPDVLSNAYAAGTTWSSDMQVTMSSVNFTPVPSNCSSNCTYTAKVVWSTGAAPRPCSTLLTSAKDSDPPSPSSLPADTFGSGTLIVVDLKYQYRPRFAGTLIGALPISRSFYIQPRYVKSVAYSQSGSGFVTACPSS